MPVLRADTGSAPTTYELSTNLTKGLVNPKNRIAFM